MMNEQVSQPLVSIVLPIYNVEDYVAECLTSILNQTYANIEVICVDDGSTDGTPRKLVEFAARHDNVRVVTQPNAGAGSARNRGIDEASGKYICFVDPDDAILPTYVERMVEVAEMFRTDIVISCLSAYDDTLRRKICDQTLPPGAATFADVFSGEDLAGSLYTTFKNTPSPVIKFYLRDFILKNGLRYQTLPRSNDLCFSYSALALARRIHYVNETFYLRRTGRCGSAQNTTDLDSTPVCRAYLRLRQVLEDHGKFLTFEKTFYRSFYNSLRYVFRRLKRLPAAMDLWNFVHSEEINGKIAGARLAREDFCSAGEFERYLEFWQCKDPLLLMLTESQRSCLSDFPHAHFEKPGEVIGLACGNLTPGGIQRSMTYLVPLFQKNGLNVVLMTDAPATDQEFPLPDGCLRVAVGSRASGSARTDRIRTAVLKYGISRVIFQAYYNLEIEGDIEAAHSAGARALVHHRSVFSNMYLRKDRELALPKLLAAYRKADAMLTLSRIDARFFNMMGCNAFHITNPVPVLSSRDLKRTPGHVIVWVARFVEGKRPLDAIKVAERVQEFLPDIRLVMLGGGHDREVTRARAYLDARPKLKAAVEMVGYTLDAFGYERKADVFLTTTMFEGFSHSIIEAKALGLPVVSYAMPYLETIVPGSGVAIVPQGDIEGAAREIVRILTDRDLYADLSRRARASYEEFAKFDQWAAYKGVFDAIENGRKADESVDAADAIIVRTLLDHVSFAFERVLGKKRKRERCSSGPVGLIFTWPMRRAARMLKCYRENGLKYTLRRLILGKGRGRR